MSLSTSCLCLFPRPLFLCTPVTHWLITACVFKSVFSPHSPLVCLFDKHFVGLFLQGVWLFALGLLSNAILRANTRAEPNWQYVTHHRECLWIQCGTVHSGCCGFYSSWGKWQYHSHFFSVFSGHVAANLKSIFMQVQLLHWWNSFCFNYCIVSLRVETTSLDLSKGDKIHVSAPLLSCHIFLFNPHKKLFSQGLMGKFYSCRHFDIFPNNLFESELPETVCFFKVIITFSPRQELESLLQCTNAHGWPEVGVKDHVFPPIKQPARSFTGKT